VNIKILCKYPHNEYLTNMTTNMGRIFMWRVKYRKLLFIPVPSCWHP